MLNFDVGATSTFDPPVSASSVSNPSVPASTSSASNSDEFQRKWLKRRRSSSPFGSANLMCSGLGRCGDVYDNALSASPCSSPLALLVPCLQHGILLRLAASAPLSVTLRLDRLAQVSCVQEGEGMGNGQWCTTLMLNLEVGQWRKIRDSKRTVRDIVGKDNTQRQAKKIFRFRFFICRTGKRQSRGEGHEVEPSECSQRKDDVTPRCSCQLAGAETDGTGCDAQRAKQKENGPCNP